MESSLTNPTSLTAFLYGTMCLNGMKIYPDSWEVLDKAVKARNFKFLDDKNGEASGFLTWHIEDNKIWVMNLTIFERKRSGVDLFHLRKFFRDKYPGYKFGWHNDRRVELFEIVK